jgi:hypothetical protein
MSAQPVVVNVLYGARMERRGLSFRQAKVDGGERLLSFA